MRAPFTLAIKPSGAPATLGAVGRARASISARGTMTWAGKLASVSGVRSLTHSTDAVLLNGWERYPLFATLPNSETFSGWIKADHAQYHLDGEYSAWNASAVADVWNGSDVSLSIRGSLWVPPVPPARVLNLADGGSARFLVGEDVSQDILITQAHRVLPAGSAAWPSTAAGGFLRTAALNVTAGTFSGATWGRWTGARVGAPLEAQVPFGNIEGVLVSRLGRGVGILRNLDPKDTSHAKALPAILKPIQ